MSYDLICLPISKLRSAILGNSLKILINNDLLEIFGLRTFLPSNLSRKSAREKSRTICGLLFPIEPRSSNVGHKKMRSRGSGTAGRRLVKLED